jgi:CRP-like cAMP-binding protein
MVKRPSVSASAAKAPIDGDGKAIANKILLSLPRKERDQVLSKLELVRLKLHQVIHEAGETIKSGYFVNAGVISVLAVQPDGKSVEVGLIGNEGFVGLPLLVGYRSSPTRLITQGDGTAYRCDADAQRLAMQTTQIAACNRLHDVVERLARWIMMTHDRILSDNLPLTQEFLGQMLGTRRSSVTVAAGALQKAGLISYTRGSVKILSRKKLEDAACDCYGIVQRQLTAWETEGN